jgi:hypothetical protein
MQFSSMKTALKRNKLMAICYAWHSDALTKASAGSAKLARLAGSGVTCVTRVTLYHAANPQLVTWIDHRS